MRQAGTRAPDPLRVHVTEDERILVHVGTRFVEATVEELDRILQRLAAQGGAVAYSRDDPAEEPGPAALEVMALIAEHDLPFETRGMSVDDFDAAGL